jgi:hypothetical protein
MAAHMEQFLVSSGSTGMVFRVDIEQT